MHPGSLLATPERAAQLKAESLHFQSVPLSPDALCDLELLLGGAFAPLTGFMGRAEYDSVLDDMRLAEGTLWPVPLCLELDAQAASRLTPGQPVALRDGEGFMLAVLHPEELWQPDMRREALALYGTLDPKADSTGEPAGNPQVRRLLDSQGCWYVSGRVEGVTMPPHFDFLSLRLTPAAARERIAEHGWRNVAGFQATRPLHGMHEQMLLRAAKDVGGSILALGVTGQEVPPSEEQLTLVRCLRLFFDTNFPRNMAALTLAPLRQRAAGLRQALLEALVHRNYGCTHTLAAPELAADAPAMERLSALAAEAGITAVPLHPMVYQDSRAQYVPLAEACPDEECRDIPDAEFRRRLEFGLDIPAWYSPPAVVEELRRANPPRSARGFTVFLTGLSGAGKSTLARLLCVRLREMRTRPVTLLDGDIVRRMLSSELTFSREHRILNIRRIAYVASEITKNRGVAICAPIAPFEEARAAARRMVEQYGGFIEVYVNTPLDVCVERDRKGIYAKARAGLMKGVTGIDDPYEPPTDAEITIDTSRISPVETVHEVLLYLERAGYIR